MRFGETEREQRACAPAVGWRNARARRAVAGGTCVRDKTGVPRRLATLTALSHWPPRPSEVAPSSCWEKGESITPGKALGRPLSGLPTPSVLGDLTHLWVCCAPGAAETLRHTAETVAHPYTDPGMYVSTHLFFSFRRYRVGREGAPAAISDHEVTLGSGRMDRMRR